MLTKIFKKKISEKRLARATEHNEAQRAQAEARARAKSILQRMEARKQALKE